MLSKPVSDEFIIAGDVTLHYVQWGEQGPPIVCVHGLTANAFCFQSYADELASDHRVIAYDLRGRGDSDKLEDGYSIPIHTDDLSELIDELGLERPIIIGHSLGALIALNFAAQYPDKLSKLVLVDAGAPLPWKTPAEQPLWLTTAISRLGVPVASYDEYIARLKAAPFLGPYWNEYVDLYFKHDVYPNSDGTVASKAYREAIIE
jgi:pimeloyl-ACP methyl ester carboxylesterase